MIRITPPTLYISPDVKITDELEELIEEITCFFNQPLTKFFKADLVLSNNAWVLVPDVIGGYRRLDVQFDLIKLTKVEIYPELIIFSLNDGSVYSLRLTEDFFYFLEWEDDYYN